MPYYKELDGNCELCNGLVFTLTENEDILECCECNTQFKDED